MKVKFGKVEAGKVWNFMLELQEPCVEEER